MGCEPIICMPQLRWRSTLQPDPIVAEIRAIRESLAAEFNYDMAALAQDARQLDAADDRPVVRREPVRPVATHNSEVRPSGPSLIVPPSAVTRA